MESKKEVEVLVERIYALKFQIGLYEPHELENINTPFVSWVEKCLTQLEGLIAAAPLDVSVDDPF